MAEAWIRFTYGEGWGSKDGKDVMVIGPREEITFASEEEYDVRYRNGRGKVLEEIGWEKCYKLAELLQGVYEERIRARL